MIKKWHASTAQSLIYFSEPVYLCTYLTCLHTVLFKMYLFPFSKKKEKKKKGKWKTNGEIQ